MAVDRTGDTTFNSYDLTQAPINSQEPSARQNESVFIRTVSITDSTENGGSGAGQATIAEHIAADATTAYRFALERGLYYIEGTYASGALTFFALIGWDGGNNIAKIGGSAVVEALTSGDTGDGDVTFAADTELLLVNTLGSAITELRIRQIS